MNIIEQLSPLEDAAEDGDVIRFMEIMKTNPSEQDLYDSMDTAWRGTKVIPPVKGCQQILDYLHFNFNITIPNYDFNGIVMIKDI